MSNAEEAAMIDARQLSGLFRKAPAERTSRSAAAKESAPAAPSPGPHPSLDSSATSSTSADQPTPPPISKTSTRGIGNSNATACNISRKAAMREELKSATIMVVDDDPTSILTICDCLKQEGYQSFLSTTCSGEAINILRSEKPDCLLLDIKMPKVGGMDILRTKAIDPDLDHVPTIMLTASNDPQAKRQALELEATDFLTKPIDPQELILRVRNALLAKAHVNRITDESARLEELVQRRTAELHQSRQQLILSLARAAEHRDNESSNHVIRVGRYAGLIASRLGWKEDKIRILEQAAQLHDVGKIGIDDSILFDDCKVDPQEYALLKDHCSPNRETIEPLSKAESETFRSHARFGSDILHTRTSPLMMMASRIAQTHHERWDGSGYPLGLAGANIPIEGRITAVADVYDSLSTARPYKEAFPREKCFDILRAGSGTQFDPEILDAFFSCSEEIVGVQIEFLDRPAIQAQFDLITADDS